MPGRTPVGKLLMVGLIAGLMSGAFGVGGGIVMVPLMVGYLAWDQHTAHASSLAAIIIIAISGAARFAVAGEVDVAVALALGVGGLVGSTVGAHLMAHLSPQVLRGVFGAVMVAAGLRMALGADPPAGAGLESWAAWAAGVGIGLLAGLASGVAGIGGGVIMVPAMVFLLGLDQHAAEGTSLLAVLFSALAGTRVNVNNRYVRLRDALVIGLGGLVSAQIGASVALLMDAALLSRVFGVFVGVVGIRMVAELWRKRGVTP